MPAEIRTTNIAPEELTDAVAEWIDSSCDQYLVLDNQDYSIKAYQIADNEDLTEFATGAVESHECQIEAKSENIERKVIIKTEPVTLLERHVIAWLNEQAEDYGGDLECVYKDLQETGYPPHLTYYRDTEAFVMEYREYIEDVIENIDGMKGLILENGVELHNIYDMMARIAFEETTRSILSECGIEI